MIIPQKKGAWEIRAEWPRLWTYQMTTTSRAAQKLVGSAAVYYNLSELRLTTAVVDGEN